MANSPELIRSLHRPLRIQRRATILRLVAVASMFSLFGCGASGPEIGHVEGTITLDSKPLPDAFVFFRHADGGRISQATTDANGHYELVFTADESGAIVGSNTVRITTFVDPSYDDSGELLPGTNLPELVPAKYNQNTELTVDVQSGSNEFNFDLASK